MSKSRSWRSILANAPAAVEQIYQFEDDDSADVLKMPTRLDDMHRLASSLISERVTRQAERDRATRALERLENDLRQVHEAIDEKLKEIELRGVRAYGDGNNETRARHTAVNREGDSRDSIERR